MPTDRDAGLHGTPISINAIESAMQGACGTKSSIANFTSKPIGGQMGFMSEIFAIKIAWQPDDAKLPKSVVVKVPTGQNAKKHFEEMKSIMDEESVKAHENTNWAEFLSRQTRIECLAMEYFRQVQEKMPNLEIRVPKLYYHQIGYPKEPELPTWCILEDFSEVACVPNMADGMNIEQILSAVDNLAILHVASLGFPDGWQVKFMEGMKMDELPEFVAMMKCITKQLATISPPLSDLVEKLLPHFTVEKFMNAAMSGMMSGMPGVLVHGDLWIANMLFGNQSANSSQLISIIDWATGAPGNPAQDIARMLWSSVDGTLRRAETDRVLEHYHKRFHEEMKSQMQDSTEKFTLTQLQSAYNACLPCVMMFTVFGVPMWMRIPEITHSDDVNVRERRLNRMIERARMLMEDYLAVHGTD